MQTVIIRSDTQRHLAKRIIDAAPINAVVKIGEAKRSGEQSDKMWAMLSDISRAKPGGRRHTPEVWKSLAMHACGHAVQFEMGINGEPFPIGFRSSQLTVSQMSALIEFLYAFGAEHEVVWSEPVYRDERSA